MDEFKVILNYEEIPVPKSSKKKHEAFQYMITPERSTENNFTLFHNFQGDVGFFQMYQAPDVIKEKKKLIGKNTLIPFEEAFEKYGHFYAIPFEYPYLCSTYKEFMEKNLLENIERPIIAIYELYPKTISNLNFTKIYLKQKLKNSEAGALISIKNNIHMK